MYNLRVQVKCARVFYFFERIQAGYTPLPAAFIRTSDNLCNPITKNECQSQLYYNKNRHRSQTQYIRHKVLQVLNN